MRRLFYILALLIANVAYAADIVTYINTDDSCSPSNNGTFANPYCSCSEWEADQQTNLVTDGNTHTVYARGSTVDSTACVIDGWTTDATHTITFNGNYEYTIGNTSYSTPVKISDPYVTWKRTKAYQDGASKEIAVIWVTECNVTVTQNLVYHGGSLTKDSQSGAIQVFPASSLALLANCAASTLG